MRYPKYDESWNMFGDRKKGKWLKVPVGDPRGTHQLCVKGCAVDVNYDIDDFPKAAPITDAEQRVIDEENAKWLRIYPMPK